MTNTLLFNRYASADALLSQLKDNMFGQDDALETFVETLVAKNDKPHQPQFIHLRGDIGMGKTHLVKTVADAIGVDYIHVDPDCAGYSRFDDTLTPMAFSRNSSELKLIAIDDVKHLTYKQVEFLSDLKKGRPYSDLDHSIIVLMDNGYRNPEIDTSGFSGRAKELGDQRNWENKLRDKFLLEVTKVELKMPDTKALVSILKQQGFETPDQTKLAQLVEGNAENLSVRSVLKAFQRQP